MSCDVRGTDASLPLDPEVTKQSPHRAVLLVASLGLFGPALTAWSSIVQLPAVGIIATVGCAAIMLLALGAMVCRSRANLKRLDTGVLLLALSLLGAWAAATLYFYPAYGTDEAAFIQYSAQLLLHGHDPYKANLLPALTQFRVPIQFATYKLNGTIASNLAYPAASFLLLVPVDLVTHGVQAIIIENVLFLAAELVLLFLFLPTAYRALSVVTVLGLSFLFDYTIGGDIVTLAVPFLLVVAHHWTDTGRQGRLGRAGATRAVCLGIAASICQFPWFIVPFILLGLWRCRSAELGSKRAARLLFRFVAVAAVPFVVLNGPFIAWDARAWLSGILSPLLQHAIPFGQGLIDASAFFGVGGGNLAYYTDAGVAIMVLLLVLYAEHFGRLWRAAFTLPSLVFFFTTRSLSEYFIMAVATWLVAAMAGGPESSEIGALDAGYFGSIGSHFPKNRGSVTSKILRGTVPGLPALAAVTCIALALTSLGPLRITIKSVNSNGQFQSIWRIRAEVRNHSNRPVQPHFATDASGYMTTFWNVVTGPETLGPGREAIYTLVAPNVGSMPGVTQPFVLQAVTASPESISSSALFTPQRFDCYISPSYVDSLLPLGGSVSLTVQLRSPYGAAVHSRGVPVALAQVIYGQNDLIAGEAEINGAPEGQSPVIALTNAEGTASFRIWDSSIQGGNPLYFQAYVNPARGYPYGYSEIVSVQWVSSDHSRGRTP